MSKMQCIAWAYASVALLCLLTTLVGGVIHFSSVPFYDAWGPVELFSSAKPLQFADFFAQHNEHRIVWTRCLFWLDFALFKGRGIFLLLLNYVLLALIYALLIKILQEKLPASSDQSPRFLLSQVILVFVFSWIQNENLTWTFQSQFFLTFLFPLAAFYYLHRSQCAHSGDFSWRYFSLACILGIAALGSMANGVLALPLLTLMAVILSIGWQRISGLLLLSILGVSSYFYAYHAVNPSLLSVLFSQPLDFCAYALLYLGGPFYVVAARSYLLIGQVTGVFLLASLVFFSWQAYKKRCQSSLNIALLFFLFYVCATALATAGGRLHLGMQFAGSSRYMTPTLIAWSVVLILYAQKLAGPINALSRRCYIPLLGLQLLFLVAQADALNKDTIVSFERQISALALAMHVTDKQQLGYVFPDVPSLQSMARFVVAKDLSVFSEPQIMQSKQILQQHDSLKFNQECIGHIDSYRHTDDAKYVQVVGWLYDHASNRVPETIHITNQQREVVGYALTGQERVDLKQVVHPDAVASGFKGYMLKEYIGSAILLKGFGLDCALAATIPMSIEDQFEQSLAALASKLKIQDQQQLGRGWFNAKPALFTSDNRYQAFWSTIQPLMQRSKATAQAGINCSASIDAYQEIPNAQQQIGFTGKVTYIAREPIPELITLENTEHTIVGYGMTLPQTNMVGQSTAVLRGYLLSKAVNNTVRLQSFPRRVGCNIAWHLTPFKIAEPLVSPKIKILSAAAIGQNRHWTGTDPQKTQFAGYQVWGSYMQSDADVGEITLNMSRGSAFFYRSGAKSGKQILIFNGNESTPILLPQAVGWVEMQFTGFELPEHFSVQLIDQGTEAGEWSAIGVKN